MNIREIESRRSIRKFRPDAIPEMYLRQAIEAARLAPSSKNDQPWKFIVLGPESREKMLSAMEYGIRARMENGGDRKLLAGALHTLRIMKTAPALVLVENTLSGNPFAEIAGMDHVHEMLNLVSVGAAVENFILEAESLGLGTLWIGFTIMAYDEIVEAMGIEGQLTGALAVGFPDEAPEPRPRKAFEEIAEFRA